MKVANFPERVNQRRIRALSRMSPSNPAFEDTKNAIVGSSLKGVKTKKKGRRDGKAAKLRF